MSSKLPYLVLLALSGACDVRDPFTQLDPPADAGPDGPTTDSQVSCGTRGTRIAFDDGADGAREVWIANPDGSALVNVSNNAAEDRRPSWSPDGRSLIFETNRNGNFDIYFVRADGTGIRNLTEGSAVDDMGGVWSPDGQRIAFIRAGTVWTMKADGSEAAQLSSLTAAVSVSWSKDSTKVVFEANPAGMTRRAVHIVAVGSTASPIQLSPDGAYAEHSSAAPADKVLFSANAGSLPANIWTVNLDGTGPIQVDTLASADHSPQWTDDGQTIVFSSNRANRFEIWKMPAAPGGTPIQLTSNTDPTANVRDFVSDVSPEGLIAFRRDTQQPSASEIGVIGLDGTGGRAFSAGPKNAFNPKFGACQ